MEADRLFLAGQFAESYDAARSALEEVTAVAGEHAAQWRGELLGLIGRNALQLYRLDEALDATREALHGIHALQEDRLYPFMEGQRENLLTVIAALEPPDAARTLSHRHIRDLIIRAQALADRHRFAQSIAALEPLQAGIQSLGPLPSGGTPPAEPADPRLWYLPRVLGLLGFNWFHLGDSDRAKAATSAALEASRVLGDKTGERIYRAGLETIELGRQPSR